MRRTKEEMLQEFHRLYDIIETYEEFLVTQMDTEEAAEYVDDTISRQQMLTALERNELTLSEAVSGVRQAINDNNFDLADSVNCDDDHLSDFLNFYKTRTGRTYYDDAGCVKNMARAIFGRGKIADDTEYYLMKEILIDTAQTVFEPKEMKSLNLMMANYEDTVAKG
ncbi:hypothetical protein [Anderseniella sp. Alg231-50]|uniref:hypothetical protein n=1 Tax=Anderseniella sp. Alg231-50 TaxID=1922226 RepID=UPI000D54C69E